MRKQTLHALTGLGLALVLALVGGAAGSSPSDDDGTTTTSDRDERRFAAAAVNPPVTMDIVPPTTTTTSTTTTTTTAPPPPPPPPPPPEPEPAPAPEPPPAPAGSIDAIIEKHFGAAAGTAKAIASCESGMNPGAVSATDDHGLFQINRPSHQANFTAVTGASWSGVYDAELNTIYAKWLYDQQGWGPWACA